MDPQLLAEAWRIAHKAHASNLDPKDALTSYDDLFTDEFLKWREVASEGRRRGRKGRCRAPAAL